MIRRKSPLPPRVRDTAWAVAASNELWPLLAVSLGTTGPALTEEAGPQSAPAGNPNRQAKETIMKIILWIIAIIFLIGLLVVSGVLKAIF